jgi:autotransporter-associated beta strand protein
MEVLFIQQMLKRKLRLWILAGSIFLSLFSANVSEAAIYTWNGTTNTNPNITTLWNPNVTNGWMTNGAANGAVFTNTWTNGSVLFNWGATNVGFTNTLIAGFTNDVVMTNLGSWRLDSQTTLTNNTGLFGKAAGTVFIYNTTASQIVSSTNTLSGNMSLYMNNQGGHSSTAKTLVNNLGSLAISNFTVNSVSSGNMALNTNVALTLTGVGTSTITGSMTVTARTNSGGTATNVNALIVSGGVLNIATTNDANIAAVTGWNSGLVITNNGSVYIAGQKSLGEQAYNVKIGTTNAGVTTFGIFTNNEWATNSTTSVPLTNNFAISNAGAGMNIFKAQTGRILALSGTISGSTPGTVVADAGTLVLSGANTALSIPFVVTNNGTLVASNAKALGSGAVTVASSATLKVNAAITNSVTNNGGVTIADGGSLASSNGYSGLGSLTLGATASSNSASFNSSLASGTTNVGPLNLSGNSALILNLGTTINSSASVVITNTNNLITVNSSPAASIPGTNNLVVGTSVSGATTNSIFLNGSAVENTTIPLGGTYTNTTNQVRYTFTNSGTALQLIVQAPVAARSPLDLAFAQTNGVWDTTGTMNWVAVPGGETTSFLNYDSAFFTNSAVVAVQTNGVTANLVLFTNSTGTIVNLSGGVVNAGNVGVSGGGQVALSNNVIVSGIETISSGTLQIASGATNSVNGLVLSGGTISGSGTLSNSSLYDMQAGTANIVLNGTNGLNKSTEGTVILGAINAYTGTTKVEGGTLQYGVNNAIADGGAVAVTGGTLNLGSYSDTVGAVTVSGGNITSTTGVLTGTSYNLANGAGVTNTISAILGGTGVLVKTNAGTVVLSGANTYSGATTITNGVLTIQNSASLGGTNAGTTVGTGAVLQLQGGIAVGAEALTLNGAGVSSGGALRSISGNNTYGGAVNLGSTSRINSDAGTLILNNAADITGATFGLTLGGAGNIDVGSVIGTTTGTLTKDGTGTATLLAANTYSGATTISNGSLVFGVSNAIAANNTVNVGGGATLGILNLGGFNNTNTLASVVISNGVITNGTITAAAYRITNTSGAVLTNTISANLAGTGGLNNNVTNATTLLSGSNSYTGVTRVELGTLQLGDSFALGAGGSDVTTVGTQMRGGILDLNGQTNINEALLFADANSYVTNSSTTTATWSGSIFLSNSTANNFNVGSGRDIVVTGSITNGSASRILNKNGDGVLTFSNANTNQGVININAGTLRMGNSLALGRSDTSSNIVVASGATLDVNGYTAPSVRAFSIAGTGVGGNGVIYNSSASAATLSNAITMTNDSRVGTVGNLTLSGGIGGAFGLTKVGSGTLFLSASNSYSGGTTISNGAISISSGNSLGGGSITLSGSEGDTAKLVSTFAGGTDAASITTLTLGGVSMDGSAILSLSSAYTQFSVTSLSLGLSSNSAIGIGSIGWDVGTYTLLSSSSDITGGENMSLLVDGTKIAINASSKVGRNTYQFIYNNNQSLSSPNSYGVNVTGGAYNLVWNGSQNNDWNTTAPNWNQSGSSDNIAFVTGDNVNFAGLGATTIAVDSGGVTAGTMVVANSSGPLTLSGGTVKAALTVATDGNLIVEGAINPNGVLSVDGGILQIGSGGETGVLGNTNTINLANSGSLVVNRSTIYTLSNQVTGAGSFTKLGSGTNVLANSNSYSGQTTVAEGTLQIGSAVAGGSSATPGSGQIVVNNGATLAFYRTNLYTNANNISGAGSVSQLATTNLELGGSNTFSGGLYLNTNANGMVWASSGNNLGSGIIYAVSSNSRIGLSTLGLTPSSASMTITNQMSTSLTGTNTDVLAFTPKSTNTYSIYLDGPITGAGWLKIGSSAVTNGSGVLGTGVGNLYVNNTNNNYSGGTELGNGRIIIGNGAALGSGAILFSSANLGNTILKVTNDTTLSNNFTLGVGTGTSTALAVIDTTNTVTLGGVISNRSSTQVGSLVKVGTGTVILPNTNTYTGGTTITDGTLVVSGALTGGSLLTIGSSPSSRLVLRNTLALANTTSLNGESAGANVGTLELAADGNYTLNSYGVVNNGGSSMNFTNSSRSNSILIFTNSTNYITVSSTNSGSRFLSNNSPDLTITFDGAVDIGSSINGNVTFGGAGNFVVNGSIFNNNTGVRLLIKTGNGTLSLRGTNNTYSSTTVSGGNLEVVSTNLSAQITTNTVFITFSNGVGVGSYKILPGALTGTYPAANYTNLSTGLNAAFNQTNGEVLVSVAPPTGTLSYSPLSVVGMYQARISSLTPSGVTGLELTYSISPTLPTGLSIDSNTGVISGTPLAAKVETPYTVRVSNSAGSITTEVYITVSKVNQGSAVSGSLGLQTITFDGTTTVTAGGGNGSGVYEFRQSSGTGAVNFSGAGASRTITPTAAGTAVIEVRRVADNNYNDSSWVSVGTLTVNPANQAGVSGSLGSATITFDGTTTVTAGGGNGSGVYEFRQSSGTGTVRFSGTGASRTITPTAAGTAVIEVRRVADSNYNDSSWVSAGTLTVNKANQAAVLGSLGLQTITVGGTTTVTASGGTGTGAYEFRQGSGTGTVGFSGTGDSRTIVGNTAGTAVIEVRRVADSNYNDSSWVTVGTLTVNPAGSTYTSVGFRAGTEYETAENGLSNLMNYALGQNGPNAPLPAKPVLSTDSNGMTLTATARTDDSSLKFYVEWTTDLSGVTDSWDAHSNRVFPPNLTGTITYGQQSKFLRIKVSK